MINGLGKVAAVMHKSHSSVVGLAALCLMGCPEDPQPTETTGDGTPIVAIISPVSMEVLENGVITVEAIDDKGIVEVEIYVNNIKIATLNVPPYSVEWEASTFPDSSVHLIYAKAYDGDGNVGSSPVRTFILYRLTPTDLSAIVLGDTIVALSWRDNSRRETGFEIEQSVSFGEFDLVKTVAADITTTLVSTSSAPPTDYRFRVRAIADEVASDYTNVSGVFFLAPLTSSRSSVSIVPGGFDIVQISGGFTPYQITGYPPSGVAIVSLDDSSTSPANLTITIPTSATVGDIATVTVADSHPLSQDEVPIVVSIVATGTISYSGDIQPIWDGNCQNRGCHPGGGAPFSLDRFVSWTNLWFAGASNMSCGAIYRVVGGLNGGPGNPDSSLLYLAISGRTPCFRMPLSLDPGDTLSQLDQDKIKSWIEQGAENN